MALRNCRPTRSQRFIRGAYRVLHLTLDSRRGHNSRMVLRGERNFRGGQGNFAFIRIYFNGPQPDARNMQQHPGRYQIIEHRNFFLLCARNEGTYGDGLHSEQVIFRNLERDFISRGFDQFVIDLVFTEREPCREGPNCHALIEEYLMQYGEHQLDTRVRYIETWYIRKEKKLQKKFGLPRHACGSDIRKSLNRRRKDDGNDDGDAGGAAGGAGDFSILSF